MKTLFVVGEVFRDDDDVEDAREQLRLVTWQLLGVFDTQEAAEAACTDDNHFYGPVELNKRLPDDVEAWPGACYPTAGLLACAKCGDFAEALVDGVCEVCEDEASEWTGA